MDLGQPSSRLSCLSLLRFQVPGQQAKTGRGSTGGGEVAGGTYHWRTRAPLFQCRQPWGQTTGLPDVAFFTVPWWPALMPHVPHQHVLRMLRTDIRPPVVLKAVKILMTLLQIYVNLKHFCKLLG